VREIELYQTYRERECVPDHVEREKERDTDTEHLKRDTKWQCQRKRVP
jgi:hypothetical protein